MVQNDDSVETKRRGRPRAYDPTVALLKARDSFWRKGYSGTSLDDIATATGMNKPSLYAAFGDKHALYLEAITQYLQFAIGAMRDDLAQGGSLRDSLLRVYDGALSIYFSDDGLSRGCFVIGTAVTEALDDSSVQERLAGSILTFDRDFEGHLRAAQAQGQLKPDADPATLAILATATLHSIAIRARAGVPRASLRQLARNAVEAITTAAG